MGFFESILLGFSIAAIPGPIFFELIRRTLARGFWFGSLLSVGEFAGNLVLATLIFFGVSNILSSYEAKIALYLAGGAILCFIGVSAWNFSGKEHLRPYNKSTGYYDSLATGFGLAVTSPIIIALWISLSGSYLARFPSKELAFENIFLITLGLLLFYFPFAAVLHKTRHKITQKTVALLSKIFGAILIVYGLSFLLDAIALVVK